MGVWEGGVSKGKWWMYHHHHHQFLHIFGQIRVIERNCEIPHEGPFCDLMWSDPEDIETWAVSPRGAGWLFGSRVTSEVLILIFHLPICYTIFFSINEFDSPFLSFLCHVQFNHINNLDLVCRAHQLVQEGLKYMFQDKGLVTVGFFIFLYLSSCLIILAVECLMVTVWFLLTVGVVCTKLLLPVWERSFYIELQ